MQYRYQGTPASRAATRAAFAAYFTTLCDTHGGLRAVAVALDVSEAAARGWLAGRYLPSLDHLVRLAAVFALDVDTVLELAGKPPLAHLRAGHADVPAVTLCSMLRSYRRVEGIENRELAARLSLSAFETARYCAGSAVPASLTVYVRIARLLATTPVALMDAAGIPADDLCRRQHAERCTGLAGTVRTALEAAGFDSWTPLELRRAAKATGIPVTRLTSLVLGTTTGELLDCQRLAALGTVGLDELLTHAGWAPAEAATFAAATVTARHERTAARAARASYVTLGELLKAYRIAGGLTQAEVATTARVGRTTVTRLESGEKTPDPRVIARIAASVAAPLPRVLAAAGWVA